MAIETRDRHIKIWKGCRLSLGLRAIECFERYVEEHPNENHMGREKGIIYSWDFSWGEYGIYVYQTEHMIAARRTYRG